MRRSAPAFLLAGADLLIVILYPSVGPGLFSVVPFQSLVKEFMVHRLDILLAVGYIQWERSGSVFLAWNFLLLWFTDPWPTMALIVLFKSIPPPFSAAQAASLCYFLRK